MALESLESSPDVSHQETLTKAQEAIVNRVLEILENDADLNTKVTETFQQNLLEIVGNEIKYTLLLQKIGESEMEKLSKIQNAFESGNINTIEAKAQSKVVIEHYTKMKLITLKQSTE